MFKNFHIIMDTNPGVNNGVDAETVPAKTSFIIIVEDTFMEA